MKQQGGSAMAWSKGWKRETKKNRTETNPLRNLIETRIELNNNESRIETEARNPEGEYEYRESDLTSQTLKCSNESENREESL